MLKAAIIACAICAGAGGAAFWLQPSHGSTEPPETLTSLPSLMELHAKAHLDMLPVQEVKEPF
jgi:hypothetical protein